MTAMADPELTREPTWPEGLAVARIGGVMYLMLGTERLTARTALQLDEVFPGEDLSGLVPVARCVDRNGHRWLLALRDGASEAGHQQSLVRYAMGDGTRWQKVPKVLLP